MYVNFPFGKHKGKTPDECPVDYLRWVIGNVEAIDPDLEAAIHASLRKRGGGFRRHSQRFRYFPPALPTALPVGVSVDVAAELVREGRRALALKYHPDRQGGDAECMTRANATADFLERRVRDLLAGGRTL